MSRACRVRARDGPEFRISPQRKSLTGGLLGEVGRARWLFEDFVGPDPEGPKDMGSERVDERNIRGVPASRDHDPANSRHVVARIERPPRPVDGHANVAKMAVDVPRWNVEASAERHREMGEIAADSDPLLEGFERCPGRSRLQIVKLDVLMDEIAHGLHAPPAGRDFAE